MLDSASEGARSPSVWRVSLLATKYAVRECSTDDVGDEIPSIAARRLLPHVDFYVDRGVARASFDR